MLILSVLVATQFGSLQASLESARGLSVVSAGIPVIKGSSFEYYEPGWKKSYYSSKYHQQTVKTLNDKSIAMSFASDDGLASGCETLRQDGSTLTVDYVFNWSGTAPSKVEVTLGNLWAPVFVRGKLVSDTATVDLAGRIFKSKVDVEERKFTPDSPQYRLTSKLGNLAVSSDTPLTLYDARGYEWADDDDQFWLGAQSLDVSPGHPATLHCEFRVNVEPPPGAGLLAESLGAYPSKTLEAANEEMPILVPKPKLADLHFESPIDISGGLNLPKDLPFGKILASTLSRRFASPPSLQSGSMGVQFIPDSGMMSGAYRLSVECDRVTIRTGSEDGTQAALARLGSLCFAKNGRLWIPKGHISDEPGIAWRGVHLFVGPNANAFHAKLWDRLLKPLGFNHVVLQCERTSWKSLPGIDTPITMKREDLVRLFRYYREIGVDPIPLVQSFGHAEWMFANGKNLDLALNPNVPYALDPRTPRTREVLTALWNEIIASLKPETVHFGLDEVDMRGWKPDPKFVTEMWKLQIPFLASIAEKHRVKMMLWGDKCLAPNQAVDAGFGDNEAEAEQRRSVVPKDALIGDWHYAGNPDPSKFETSLKVWETNGQRPVASAWFNSQNIRSFFDAASNMGAEGALITTWAGYESSEVTMLAALKQYAAMVVAADYAWNPRTDPISALPYDPMQVLKSMYFDEPARLNGTPGLEFGDSGVTEQRIGRVNFRMLRQPMRSASILSGESHLSGSELNIRILGKGSKLFLALSTDHSVEDGKPIAQVEIGIKGSQPLIYTLRYGLQVRSRDQKGVCVLADRTDGISAVGLPVPPNKAVTYCRITQIDALSGLSLHGVSLRQ